MRRIFLFGATSELGNALCLELKTFMNSPVSEVFKIGRNSTQADLIWDPIKNGYNEIYEIVEELNLTKEDSVVIALGKLPALSSQLDKQQREEIYDSNFVTSQLTLAVVLEVAARFRDAGGGSVFIFSSVASSPVLKANIHYGASKSHLDKITKHLQKSQEYSKVRISLIKPGFVATKLNAGRTPTKFSSTPEKVARDVVRKFPRELIWTPSVFLYISFLLRSIPILKWLANKSIEKSVN
jgi:NAD(P)-dependent dehydrogenase (short-subunit alcohol dehydrogenase family)